MGDGAKRVLAGGESGSLEFALRTDDDENGLQREQIHERANRARWARFMAGECEVQRRQQHRRSAVKLRWNLFLQAQFNPPSFPFVFFSYNPHSRLSHPVCLLSALLLLANSKLVSQPDIDLYGNHFSPPPPVRC